MLPDLSAESEALLCVTPRPSTATRHISAQDAFSLDSEISGKVWFFCFVFFPERWL